MRILHTGDWHLGKKLDHYNRLEEQRLVLDEIVKIADQENVDVVLIAGDLFENFNPSATVVELLYKTLKKLTHNGSRPVIAIAGNHDSPDRIESPDPLAKECGIFFLGYPNTDIGLFETESGIKIQQSEPGFLEMVLPKNEVPLRLLLTPYANEIRLKTFLGIDNAEDALNRALSDKWQYLADKYCDAKGVNLLMAHLFMMRKGDAKPEESEDERSVMIGNASAIYTEGIPDTIQYTALGHIHKSQCIDSHKNVYYCGSPIAYSFSEAEQTKYVYIVDVLPKEVAHVKKISLTSGKQLVRKRFDKVDEAIDWLMQNPEVIVELTICTDKFISSAERKQLYNAHDGIIAIIPELLSQDIAKESSSSVDLSKDMDTLFRQYFLHRKGQEISDELMELFREIKSL